MIKIHPTVLEVDQHRESADVLVYTDTPVVSDQTVHAITSDSSVATVAPVSVVIPAGYQEARFEVTFEGPGVASITFSFGSDVEVLPVEVEHVPSPILVGVPPLAGAVLTGSGSARLSLILQDVNTYIGQGFTQIRYQVSLDGGVSYRDLTDVAARGAQLLTASAPPWNLEGAQLHIKEGDVIWDFVFDDPDLWTPQRVKEWVMDHSDLLAEVVDETSVKIYTDSQGMASSLKVTGGSAAVTLGLDSDTHFGRSKNQLLTTGVINYTLYDTSSPALEARYRYRLETDVGDFSQWSPPIRCVRSALVEDVQLCRAYVNLVDESGDPLVGREVVISNSWSEVVSGSVSYSVASVRRSIVTDSLGHAELYMIRGLVADVFVTGTDARRRVKIPDQESVDLFDPDIAVDADRWKVVVDDVPTGILF